MSFSSLFKSAVRDLTAGRTPGPQQEIPAPLRLRRGGFLEIDPLPFQMIADRVNFSLGARAQPIAARGEVDLGGNTWLHRFYLDDDDTWLQVKTDGGSSDEHVSECILWRYWDVQTPGSQAELGQLAGPQSAVGLSRYTVGAYVYERAWGVAAGQTELVPFREAVFDRSDSVASLTCQHYAMLYRRDVPACDRKEYVLICVEEAPGRLQVVTSLGMDVLQADLTVT
jgi:Protein of unknown function (DUF2491)